MLIKSHNRYALHLFGGTLREIITMIEFLHEKYFFYSIDNNILIHLFLAEGEVCQKDSHFQQNIHKRSSLQQLPTTKPPFQTSFLMTFSDSI